MRGHHSAIIAILLGGTIAGLVDIGAASAINGFINPAGIAKFIAGGLIGLPAARAGGMEIVALGVALQVGMSILIAAIYGFGASLLPILKRHWLPAGLAFGVGVFFVMEYLVFPHSAIGRYPTFTPASFALNMAAMLLFGVIIAWFARGERR